MKQRKWSRSTGLIKLQKNVYWLVFKDM
jgi:hypothetical protein